MDEQHILAEKLDLKDKLLFPTKTGKELKEVIPPNSLQAAPRKGRAVKESVRGNVTHNQM